jgi:hypothetical protein
MNKAGTIASPPLSLTVTIQTMRGLGDTIYHRPFARDLAPRAWIDTPWPDLFSDLRFLPGVPSGRVLRAKYTTRTLAFTTVPGAIARAFPEPVSYRFDLPRWPRPQLPAYVIVRAPTLRQSFYAPARNPDPHYIHQAVALMKARGLLTVGVGNVGPGEVFDGAAPDVDVPYWAGELSVARLMGFVAGAALVVAGPGWTVPASIAYGVPHVIVHGGAAKWNALDKLVDERMHRVRVTEVKPDRFCVDCKTVEHRCDKTISSFPGRFADAVDKALRM